jgi:hypothetical protein
MADGQWPGLWFMAHGQSLMANGGMADGSSGQGLRQMVMATPES